MVYLSTNDIFQMPRIKKKKVTKKMKAFHIPWDRTRGKKWICTSCQANSTQKYPWLIYSTHTKTLVANSQYNLSLFFSDSCLDAMLLLINEHTNSYFFRKLLTICDFLNKYALFISKLCPAYDNFYARHFLFYYFLMFQRSFDVFWCYVSTASYNFDIFESMRLIKSDTPCLRSESSV